MDTKELTAISIGKRSGVDFSKHAVLIKKSDGLLVHHLKKPDTMHGNIKFINTNGILAVTGDYGNWIFCREFHPSLEGHVDNHYWLEKLKIASSQEPSKYDGDATSEEIKEMLADDSGEYSEDDREYLKQILEYTGEEIEYVYMAYRGIRFPKYRDHEFVPYMKKLNPWLEIIFDGFDEICRRIKFGQNFENI